MPHSSAPRQISDREVAEFSSADLQREGTRSRDSLAMDAVVHAFGPVYVIGASGGPTEIERRPLVPGMPTFDVVSLNAAPLPTWRTGPGLSQTPRF